MLEVIKFYIEIVSKFFTEIMDRWELAPNVSYFNFILAVIFVSFFISLFYKRYRKSFYSDDTNKKNKRSDK